jgi:hypothetical protein
MSLIGFHRFLISAAIAFCLGYAAWELTAFDGTRDAGSMILGLVFVALGLALGVYLWHLKSFLGYDEDHGTVEH